MSDYRRLISYIYEYEGNEKGKNVGFVKLEARNGQCRLNVNIKRMYVGGNAIGVYLLGKNGEKIFLGNAFVRGGAGEFRTTVDVQNVEGSGQTLDTYYGLVVHDVKNPWRSYRTAWEDVPIPEETNLAGDFMAEDILPGSEEFLLVASGSVDGDQQLEVEHIEAESIEAEQEPREDRAPANSPELENPEVLRYLQESEGTSTDPEQFWEELRKQYPKIQPFDYDGNSEVLTIRPQDIGRLPREAWIYGNNSFLLHGYYNFRYLILVRLEQEGNTSRYLLGVPGHYYSSEKYMANMFGFPNFVLSKKQPPNDGRFGYWYTDIKIS